MILYLHGFRSAPASMKASMIADYLAGRGLSDQWICPQLPASPAEAIDLSLQLAGPHSPHDLTLIGSSLGGYYATWLAEQLGCRAVLLNPAVHADRDLATQVGEHSTYHGEEPFVFLPEYVDELADIKVSAISRPERYFLVAATGDEVLDWREMRDHYPGAKHRIIQGSDHSISDFAQWMPEVLRFAGIDTSAAGTPPAGI
jgi:predicted esterase YcpF (UPF0227 family)